MTRHGDICACGHARHFHALKLVAGGYRNDQCWVDGCYCSEFEHEPSHLRDAARPSAGALIAEPATGRAAVVCGLVASESSPAADGDPRSGTPLVLNENAAGGTHMPRPHGPHGGSSGERSAA